MPDPFLELRKQVTESCDAPQLFGVPSIDGFADKLLFCRHSPRSMQGLCGCIATLQVSLLNPLADSCEEPCSSGTQQTVFRYRVGKVGCCYGILPCSHRLPLGPEVCGTCLHTRKYSSFTRLPEPPAKLRTRIPKILQGSAASLQPMRGVIQCRHYSRGIQLPEVLRARVLCVKPRTDWVGPLQGRTWLC